MSNPKNGFNKLDVNYGCFFYFHTSWQINIVKTGKQIRNRA